MDFVTNVLDPLGVVVGLLLAIPIVWTWIDVAFLGASRRKAWLRQIRSEPGRRPSILIVDLLPDGKSMVPQVEKFRLGVDNLKDIPADRVFTLSRDTWLSPEQMVDFVADLRRTAGNIFASGTDVLHVFFGGPAIAAAVVGAEFANACQVLLYQHDHGTYVNMGPLRHVKGGKVGEW